jgi:hypothetical protein
MADTDPAAPKPTTIPVNAQNPVDATKVDTPPTALSLEVAKDDAKKKKEPPPFIPLQPGQDTFIEPAFTVLGTEANAQAYANIVDRSNPKGAVLANKARFSLRDKESFEKRHAKWKLDRQLQMEGFKATEGTQETKEPVFHPFSSFLTSFGKTDQEIITGIARSQLRAQHYADKYEAAGISKLIDSDDSLISTPEALFDHMKNSGKFFATTEEQEFFKAGFNSKYAGKYETSPFALLQRKYVNKYKGTMHPSQLKIMMDENGFRLNPNDKEHQKLFDGYIAWQEKHPDLTPLTTRVANNVSSTLRTLTDSVISTVYTSVSSVGDPEIAWNDEFKDEEAKKSLTDKLLVLASAKTNGEVLGGFTDDAALKMVEKQFAETGGVDMDLFDEDSKKAIPAILIEVAKQVKELDERGAFKKDVRGVTSVLTILSAMVTGTIGLGMMGINSDPNSITMTAINGAASAIDWVGLGFDRDRALASFPEIWKKRQMEGMNTGAAYATWHHHLSNEGLFGASVQDSRSHRSASTFLTAFEGAMIMSVGAKAGSSVLRTAGRAAGVEKNFLERIGLQESLDATLKNIDLLSRQGVPFAEGFVDSEIKAVIDDIKAQGKIAGETVDDYEAIRRIFEGKGRVPDKANPIRMVKAGEDIINRVGDIISAKAAKNATMRDSIVEAARSGRKINYSKETMDGIKKAREALQAANPDVDFSVVPDTTIYDRIRRGGLPLKDGKEVLTQNQIRAMSADVGRTWRRVDMQDLAGFKRGQALPIQVSWVWGDNPVVNFATGTLRTGSRFAEWVDNLEKTFGGPRTGMNAIGKISSAPGVSGTTLQATNNGLFRYAMANAVVPALQFLGKVGEAGAFLQEFEMMNQRALGHDFNSTLLGMRNNYHAQMRKLLIRRASVRGGDWAEIKARLEELGETVVKEEPQSISTSVNAEKEIALIDNELEALRMKATWAKDLHSIGANGALAGSVKLFKDGMVSSASNELLLGLTDNFAGLGGGTVYAGFGRTTNAITSGFTAHMGRSNTIRERTNFDFNELRNRLDSFGHDPAGDVQRMKLLKTMIQAKDNADAIARERGTAAGEAHYAREVATIANLFRTGAEIHITNPEVRQGLVTLMEGLQMQDPDFAAEMKQHYLDTASKMGMSGEAATLYARKMLDAVMESNAANVRMGTISKEKDILEARKQRLIETDGQELAALVAGAEVLAKEAGLNVEQLFSEGFRTEVTAKEDVNTDAYGIPHKGRARPAPFGGVDTPMPEIIGGVDVSGMSPDVKERLKTFRFEFRRIKNLQVENQAAITDVNNQLTAIADETVQLARVRRVATYRDGQTITNPADGSTFTSFKNGITVWERDGKTSIFVDEKKFSVADGREEIAHAIFFTENMKDSRAQLRNMILGEQTVDATGTRQVKSKPLISDTVEGSLKLMDKFVNAHSESLSESDAVWFKATWNRGKKNFERNPDDTRLMQSVFVELAGRLYQARLELANPHMVRSGQQGSTVAGSVEMSNIPIRERQITGEDRETFLKKMSSSGRLFSKLIFGDLTVADIMNEGNPINATDINLDGKHTTAKFGDGSGLRDAAKFIQAFGLGGALDSMWHGISVDRLEGMGFVRSGNNSPDYGKFWEYGKIRHPVSNELLDIDPALMGWADQMIAHTRNRGSAPDVEALSDLESVFNEREDTSDGAKRRRLMWALASGRKKFINQETGMFRASLASMMQSEWQPIGSLIQRIITPRIGEDGDWSGMKVKKTVDGKTVLIGAPNAAQTRRIIEHIKENYGQYSEGNEIVMKNIAIFLEAIADGNKFDPNARSVEAGGAPGWTQVFIAEYSGVWEGKGVGTTKKTKVGGTHPQQRMLVPLRVIIRDSNLDVVGKKKTADEDTGEMPGMPEMYFEMFSPVEANTAKLNAWNGNLFQEGGARYWTEKQIRTLFGESRRKLDEAMGLVLENYQNGGSISRQSTERPPHESWEVLLDLANGNPGDAKKMASMVNRILGFTQTDFMEMNALEQEAVKKKGKLSGAKEARLEELREKFDPENENEKGKTPLDDISATERKMAVFYGERPNLYGRRPMRDTQSPISLFRADRFTGEAVAHVADDGTPHKVRWNQFTQGWGNANYASQNWMVMSKESLTSAGTGYNTGHREIVEGMYHKSGYTLFKMQDPQPADPNKKPNSEYFLLDPTRKLVGRGYRNKEMALDAAESHALDDVNSIPPEAGNAIEIELGNQGWKPKGINFAGRIRTQFVSADGNWRAERNVVRGSGGYDLIDIKSGIIVAEGIKLGLKADRKTPMVEDLNAAVEAAVEGGTVRLKMTEAFEAKIQETKGLADWTIVHQDGKKNKVFFASGNPAYYDIRKRLSQVLGWKKVNEVTKLMRQELGDDVVAKDWRATVDWFEGWTHNWHGDQIRQMGERAAANNRLELTEINRVERELYSLREGQQLVWKEPQEPKKPGANASQKEIDKFNSAMKRFTEESIAWNKNKKGIEELPIDEREVDLLLAWTKQLKERGDEFIRRATLGGELSDAGFAAVRAQGPIDQLTAIRNAMAEARVAGESIWYVDNAGYIIQQLMYKAERPAFGIEISHNKLLVIGDKKSEVKKANYILYAPGGQVMLRAQTREEAVEAAYKQKEPQWLKTFIQDKVLNLGYTQEEAMNLRKYGVPKNPNPVPSRTTGVTDRYNKPAQR